MTFTQQAVVETKIAQGYVEIGKYNSLQTEGTTVGLVKGKHRIQINCLGYDEYYGNTNCFKEVV